MAASDLAPRRWRVPVLLFASLALIYLATINPDPSPDVYSADFAAGHIARTGEPVPDISDFPALDRNIIREVWVVRTADGREAVGRAPGVIAASVPAYWLWQPDEVTAIPGAVTAALLTALAMTVFYLLLRDRIGPRRALVATLVLGLATPVWSVAADGMWPHTLTVLGILGMAWAADRDRWLLAGLCGGLALWGRVHAAIICAVLGAGVAWLRRRPGIVVQVGLASGAMLALMAVWTRWMYGRWDPTSGYRAGDFTGNVGSYARDPMNFLGFWISPDRGLLVWTPLLIVMAPALVRAWRGLPDWSRSLLVGGVVYLVLQGLLVRFSGGDAFYGYRTSLELVACAAPALALAADHMGRLARAAFVPVAVLQVVMIAPGAIAEGPYVLVADVWRRNAFLVGVVEQPGTTLPGVAAVLVAAALLIAALRSAPAGRLLDAETPQARRP